MAVTPLQGEIWSIDFDPVKGHEQGGFRPALVLSTGGFNTIGLELVIVAAITTTIRGVEFEVPVHPPEGGVNEESVVLAHQIRTVSHDRLVMRHGHVRLATLDQVLRMSQRLITRPHPPRA